MARLIVTRGAVTEGTPNTIEIAEGELTIGRSRDNDLTINEPSVSRHHAVIVRTAVGTILRDLGSANGTFINKRRITEEPLHDGDSILLGRAELHFEAPEEVPQATVRVDVSEHHQAPVAPQMPPPAPGANAIPSPPPVVPAPAPAEAPSAPQMPPPVAPPAAAVQAPPPTPSSSPPPGPPPMAVAPPPAPAAPAPEAAPEAAPHAAPPPAYSPEQAAGPASGEYAGFLPRLLAYLIDAVIIFIVQAIIVIPTTFIANGLLRKGAGMGGLVLALGNLIAIAFGIWYLLHFWAKDGATPGKKMLHLKIIREDGSSP